jgi:tRNA threonylcarbamoyladenosine biosynthesis protein TsaB
MPTLAIDTSTEICSVAVLNGRECLSETSLKVREGHSGTILNTIHETIGKSGCSLTDVDLIAAGTGPGSFTGIRIGIATAKGLALALGCDIRGVCTLDAIAANASNLGMPVMPVLDARKGEIFCCLYNKGGLRMTPPVNIDPEEVKEIVIEPTLFAGNAIGLYDELFRNSLGNFYIPAGKDLWYPKASTIGRLALDPAFSVTDINPVYVRASDATLLLKKSSSAG